MTEISDTLKGAHNTAGRMMSVITGTSGNDNKTGTAGADTISLLAGNDYGFGLAGNDLIYGGAGHDTLNGGDGNDQLYGDSSRASQGTTRFTPLCRVPAGRGGGAAGAVGRDPESDRPTA